MQQTLRRWEHPTATGIAGVPVGPSAPNGSSPFGTELRVSAPRSAVPPPAEHCLSFDGQTLLWTTTGRQPLRAALRYRKGVWLLGYAASNPGRLIYRESLAEWFWPGQDSSDGRRNLRVLLTDLQQVLRQLDQPQALRVERDWVRWDLPQRVRVQLPSDMPPAPFGSADAEGDESPADGVSEDFRAWWLGQESAVARPTNPALRLVALLCAHWQRIDPFTEAADVVGTFACADMQERVTTLLARFGARTLVSDGLASTFAVGLDSLSPSYRSAALQLAGQLHLVARQANLPVRMGLCFGPVLVSDTGRVSGWRLRLVERLAQVAEPDELVCDQSCADQAEFLNFDALGERSFRGFHRRFSLCRTPTDRLQDLMPVVLGQANRPLVGRDEALAVLRAALREALRGNSRVAWVRGPSGMGKTRLAVELWRTHTAAGGTAAWIEGQPERREQPWAALRVWVVQRLGTALQGMGSLLPRLAPGQIELLKGFSVTGSVGQTERHRLRQAVAALLADGPLLWVLDDVQWIDDASWQVLTWLMSERPQTLWLLTQRRTDDATEAAELEGLPSLHSTVLDLPPLSDTEAIALWRSTQGDLGAEMPAGARAQLQAARGRPLYLMCGQADGPAPHFAEYCQARCNTLGEGREVLELAALLGLVWRVDDLAALVGGDTLSTVLEAAVGLELLVPRGTDWMAFFHPTIRDFLLDVQTTTQLQHRARRVALLREHQGEWALAAALWKQADELQRAMAGWRQAAFQAIAQDDHHAALTHFEALRQHGYGMNATEATTLRLAHAQARLVVKGYGDAVVQQLACDLAAQAGHVADPSLRFGVQFLQYMGSSSNGVGDGLDQADALWRQAETPAQRMVAAWAQGNTRCWNGDSAGALQWLSAALALEPQATLAERSALFVTDPLNFARAQWLWMRSLRGDDVAALERDTQLAEQHLAGLPQPQDRCIYHCIAAFRAYTEGQFTALQQHAQAALSVAQEESYNLSEAIAGLQLALASAYLEQPADLETLAPKLQVLQAGYAAGIPTGQWMVADMLRLSGQPEAALSLCARWIDAMPQQEHRHCQMDIHRIQAQCFARLGQLETARAAWHNAQQVACAAGLQGWLHRWQTGAAPWSPDAA